MKKTLLMAGVACLFAVNANAVELNPYVSAKLSYSDMSVSGKDSWGKGSHKENLDDNNVWVGKIAAGVSTKLNYGSLRTELEYSRNEDAKSTTGAKKGGTDFTKLESQSLMLNAYYDIDTGTKFTPYVGAGIGYSKLKASYTLTAENATLSESDYQFTWQAGVGVAYAVNDNLSLDLGYRYVDMGNVKKNYEPGSSYKFDVDANEFMLGARYTF